MTGRVIELKNEPSVIASASVVGKNESEGPLRDEFDVVFPDDGIRQSSWENAESELIFTSVSKCLEKSGLSGILENTALTLSQHNREKIVIKGTLFINKW